MLNDGAKIHKTLLTEQHNFQSFLQINQQDTIPLFAIKPNGTIEFFAVDNGISPKPNWMVISLVRPGLPVTSNSPNQQACERIHEFTKRESLT
ncbi:MAG TPA: hypothetical protein VIJ25_18080, partial [Methylococcales bacterium]